MTSVCYNVFGGTLSLTQSINQSVCLQLLCVLRWSAWSWPMWLKADESSVEVKTAWSDRICVHYISHHYCGPIGIMQCMKALS